MRVSKQKIFLWAGRGLAFEVSSGTVCMVEDMSCRGWIPWPHRFVPFWPPAASEGIVGAFIVGEGDLNTPTVTKVTHRVSNFRTPQGRRLNSGLSNTSGMLVIGDGSNKEAM